MMRNDVGAMTRQETAQAMRARKGNLNKERSEIVPGDMRQSFGGLQMWADAHSRDALHEKNAFGPHSVYVCGTPQIDSTTEIVNIAYSTENLLLNAYRQQVHGFPSIVCVDCTHRLVLEGHVCMLFGTVDAGQHFHKIGYGLCAKETTRRMSTCSGPSRPR